MKSPPVDMADLDAVNYAGAAGAAAAGRLYALLTDPDREFDHRWFSADAALALDDVEEAVDRLAEYVCATRQSNAETVYLFAREEAICTHAASGWFAESEARRLAWTLFQSTCLSVFEVIDRVQAKARAERARQLADNPPLKREDSIFEEHGSLGEMLPHAVEALKAGAERQRQEEADAVAMSIDADATDEPMSAAAPLEEEAPQPKKAAAGRKRSKPN